MADFNLAGYPGIRSGRPAEAPAADAFLRRLALSRANAVANACRAIDSSLAQHAPPINSPSIRPAKSMNNPDSEALSTVMDGETSLNMDKSTLKNPHLSIFHTLNSMARRLQKESPNRWEPPTRPQKRP